jgi:hypothetical protein
MLQLRLLLSKAWFDPRAFCIGPVLGEVALAAGFSTTSHHTTDTAYSSEGSIRPDLLLVGVLPVLAHGSTHSEKDHWNVIQMQHSHAMNEQSRIMTVLLLYQS